jgi:putative membrane protein
MMWRYGDHMTAWGWALMSISMLLLLGTVVTALVIAVQAMVRDRNRDREPGPSATPEQVLAHRFARGEIDLLEYQARLDVLHGRATRSRSHPARR